MLGKNFSLLFYLKKPKNYQAGSMPIYLRITVDGEVRELTTSRSCAPNRWNKASGRALGNKEETKLLNAYLDTFQTKVYEARRQLIEGNQPVTAAALKEVLTGKSDQARLILEIFQQHNEQLRALIGHEYTAATLERYQTSLEHTRSFMQWKYQKTDLDIRQLDYEFISSYAFWLKSIRQCNHNTTIKYLGNFRKIVNHCLRSGWLSRDPFQNFKMSKKEVERVALTENELQVLADKRFPSDRLDQVRDIFLFCCFTGLAYADIKKLKRSEINTGIDGDQWIFTQRQKTKVTSRIPLLPSALAIIDKYSNHPQCSREDRVLPVLSNQKMNSYLKEIADVCHIHKTLTFHIARHTFATTVTLSNGVPMETVSKMLGHKNLRTTQHYARILDRKISEDMALLRRKLQAKIE